MTFHAIEQFPFGDIALSCVSSPPLDNALIVQRLAFTPTLPDHMAVDLVAAYRISFAVPFPIHQFSFELIRTQSEKKGDANSGERLDAQSWKIGDGLLMIGTEDGEALESRMPWLSIAGSNHSIEYLRNGFRLVLPYVRPNTPVGFHFVLAYNHVDTGSVSEWFAVDVSHEKLLEYAVLKHINGPNAGQAESG